MQVTILSQEYEVLFKQYCELLKTVTLKDLKIEQLENDLRMVIARQMESEA